MSAPFTARRGIGRRAAILGSAAMASALVLGACASTPEQGDPAESGTSAEVAAATVTLYTSEPQEKIDEIVDAFNAIYPQITVEVFRAGTGDLTARIEAELLAGEIEADILLAADAPTFESYAADELLLPLDPADIDAIDPDVVDAEGFYIGTRIIPTVIAYNTGLVDTPPSSWQELTDPQYANQIVLPNPEVSGAAAYNAAVWLDNDELGQDWLEGLAANTPVVAASNGPVAQAVAEGTQPIGIVVDYLVRELSVAGSPIAVSYPSEGVPYVSQPVGLFASTDVEEAARLFIDFLLSAEGQTIAVEQSYLPVRGDVGTPEGAPDLAEITILSPDLEVITATQPDAVRLFVDLFN